MSYNHFAYSARATKIALGVSLAAVAVNLPAIAQDGEDDLFSLEEITVTAQKREQSQQDVPISLNAFSGNFIDQVAADDLSDLTAYVPGLEGGGVSQAKFEIRGVQTSDFGVGTDSAVGVYVDGVYAARSGAAVVFFSDVNRVEVLKGPQGTLFGRNTAAGAISIHTNRPDLDAVEGKVKLRYGRYNKRLLEGMVNVPISDDVAIRANLLVNERDGYVKDSFTGDDYGRQNNDSGRIQLRWEPSSDTAFNLTYEFDRTNQDEEKPVIGVANGQYRWKPNAETFGDLGDWGDILVGVGGAIGLPFGDDVPLGVLDSIPLAALYAQLAPLGYNGDLTSSWQFIRGANTVGGADPLGPVESDIGNGHERRDLDRVNLHIEHDFGWGSFTSISSYAQFDSANLEEEDGTNNIAFYFDTENVEDNEQWSQEIRLNGSSDSITWSAGASYYKEKAYQASDTNLYTDSLDTALYNLGGTTGALFLGAGFNPLDGINACESMALDSLGGFVSFFDIPLNCFDGSLPGLGIEQLAQLMGGTTFFGRKWNERMEGWGKFSAFAAYADATWHATDNFNFTAGIRYTRDKKSWEWLNGARSIEGYDELSLAALGGLNLADISQQLLSTIVGGNGDIVFNHGLEGQAYKRSDTWSNVSPRFVVDYRLSDEAMVYASYTLGYKAGGYNSVEVNSFFENEKVWNFEAGLKSDWFDNTLRFNASVWKYKYNDKQSISLQVVEGSPVPQYVTQTEDTSGEGLDLEVLWAPTPGLRFFVNGGYQDVVCSENCGNKAEGEPTGIPSTRISAGVDYSMDMGNSGRLDFHLDHNYKSKNRENGQCKLEGTCGIVTVGNVMWETGRPQNTTNARITWANADDDLQISGFIKNIFNNRYPGGAGGLVDDTLGAPIAGLPIGSVWGIDLTKHF